MRYRMTAFLMLVVSISLVLPAETNAAAATLTVTKTDDTADGSCDADCSLREAIAAAGPGNTILFSSLFDTPQTITLAGSELVIDKNLTVMGTGADRLTLSGNNQSRVFHVQSFVLASLSGMTITGGNGGGVLNEGSLTVDSCHITGNAAGSGGGIGSFDGSMTIRNSTISNNTAFSRGGGIWFDADVAFSIRNSTVSGNTVSSVFGEGGGIWVRSSFGGPNVLIWNSTITNNYPGGVHASVQVPGADVFSSVIAANQNNLVYPDVDGRFTTSGHNLIGNIGTAEGLDSSIFPTSIIGNAIVQADPKLGPLAHNGGPTPTHALLPCSLAIDWGVNVAFVPTDQRGTGFSRSVGGGTDIGAFELQTFTPTICNTGPPTIDATNVVVQQGTMGDCPTCPWFDIAAVTDPDGLFGLGIEIASANPSNGVTLSNIFMWCPGVFSAQISASCTASDATLTLIVHDGRQFQASDTLTVNVTPETTPPVIIVRPDPITLFPNDHKYLTLPLRVGSLIDGASDNCDSSVNSNSAVITQVTSDEPENAPGNSDGNTTNDIVIAPDCKSVQLRAERDGNRDGRVYTITLRVRDAAGNTTTATRKVTVPLSQNGNPAIESAAQYTVTSNCP